MSNSKKIGERKKNREPDTGRARSRVPGIQSEPVPSGKYRKRKPKGGRASLGLMASLSAALIVLSLILLPAVVHFDKSVSVNRLTYDRFGGGYEGFATDPSQSGELLPFGFGLVIQCLDNEVQVLNISGQVEYAIRVTVNQPRVIADDRHALLYDLGGTYYCLLSATGPVFEGRTDDSIQGASRGDSGHVGLILDRYNTRGVLRVLDPEGNQIFEWISKKSENSGYVVSSSFSLEGEFVDISLMNTDGSNPRPVILRLTLTGEQPGDELLRLQPDIRAALPKLIHTADSLLWMTDGQAIFTYDVVDETTVLRYNFSSIHSLIGWGDHLAVVGVCPEREGVRLYLLSGEQADLENGLPLQGDSTVPMVSDQYLAIASGSQIYLLNRYNIERVRTLDVSEPVQKMSLNSAGDIIYVTRSGVGLIEN
ncbi:MAG: DUF5711 family protein [Fastidiosipilaceae bacterium]